MSHAEDYENGKIASTSGRLPKTFAGGAPEEINPETGQHKAYWVLSESERAKGFIRPVRNTYRHVGTPGPNYPLRDLTPEEHERYDQFGYVKFEEYPENSESSIVGQYWTEQRLNNVARGCRTTTSMGRAIAETYASNPRFYGSTFCVACGKHLKVGADGEFVWEGTDERVGT